ncbi:hypothetical protein [Salisaeta longa]|uniref:hypothetical protein n=1 Tax=Salisaeta longa TaxID=503170 RepID=UPI0003B79C3E|nr:hypothetical protein [Salisaeta longa]
MPNRPPRISSPPRNGRNGHTRWTRHGTALPGWKEIERSTQNHARERTTPPRRDSFFEGLSTGRFALLVLCVGVLFTAYVGHVQATQELLNNLERARTLNQELHLRYNRVKGAYDRATGPSVIHRRARALGLQEAPPSEHAIVVPK